MLFYVGARSWIAGRYYLVSLSMIKQLRCGGKLLRRFTAQFKIRSGAAIPGAAVKATQSDTGVFRTATTEADGSYVLSNLPLGPYRIEVQRDGFALAVQSGIVLQVGSDPAVAVTLQPGAVTETVNVEANAALVETRTTAIGSVMENERILDLPFEWPECVGSDDPFGRGECG